MSTPVEERDVVETLDAVDRLWQVRVDAEAEMFELAAHFADLNPAESAGRGRAGHRVIPGMERGIRLGGKGTPMVAEFAAAELGGRMRMGSWAARAYLADALDVRHRLPRLWEKVRSREARIPLVRAVAARTRHLSAAAAAEVDAAMAEVADGSLPWSRFETRLAGKIVAADPALAAQREEERLREQFARRTRSSENGMAGFYLRSTVGVIARLDATVAFLADALKAFGDPDDLDQRRVKAIVLLANPSRAVELLAAFTALRARTIDVPLPLDDEDEAQAEAGTGDQATIEDTGEHTGTDGDEGGLVPDPLERMDAFARRVGFEPSRLPSWLGASRRDGRLADAPTFAFDWSRLLPPLTLNLHLSVDDLTRGVGGVVRWQGEGPITHQFVRDHLRPLHAYRIQPVIDLAGMAPVDAYELPDRHRQAVRLRSPADASPFSSNLSDAVDDDHVREYEPASGSTLEKDWSTRLDNIIPLGRFTHRLKTHGCWTVRQPFHGIVLWRDPHGQVYLVDHTGTRKVTRPGATAGPATERDPDIELYPAPDLEIDPGA